MPGRIWELPLVTCEEGLSGTPRVRGLGTPWCRGQVGRGKTGVSRRQLGGRSEVPQGAPAGSWGRSEQTLKLEDAGQERVGPRRRTEVACCPAGDVSPAREPPQPKAWP